jgi:hypothetical protein
LIYLENVRLSMGTTKLKIKQASSFMTHEFTLTESARTTKLYKMQGLDFTIQQKQRGKDEAHLSHYSDPGIQFFVVLMKFLHETKNDLPVISKPTGGIYDEFRSNAGFFATDAARSKFPISYQYYYDVGGQGKPPVADFKLVNQDSKKPELEVTTCEGHKMIISVEVAQAILKIMPQMYPTFDSFHIAYETFLEGAKQLGDSKGLAQDIKTIARGSSKA